jgi:two-component system sensor histidine kinase KdpD
VISRFSVPLRYVAAAGCLGLLTSALAPVLDERHIIDVSLLYLLVTLIVAARWGYGPGLFTAVLADLLVNFFFIPPLHRFSVQQPANLAALALFLAVAGVGAFMLSRLRQEAARARDHERETEAMLEVTRELAHAESPGQAINRVCAAAARAAGARGCSLLVPPTYAVAGSTIDEFSAGAPSRGETAVLREAAGSGAVSRMRARDVGTRNLTFVPLPDGSVLRFVGDLSREALSSRLLQTLLHEASLAVERARLAREAGRTSALERADEFKLTLLSSVSHDLRTPLTAIKAAVSSLREDVDWSEDDRQSFLETIESQADRLTGTVSNLLQMTRLEGGAVHPSVEAIELVPLLEEVRMISSAMCREREIVVQAEPCWLRADYGLLVQAICNLVENAARYSTAACPIRVSGSAGGGRVKIRVEDGGPGISAADLPHIFEKFYRGTSGVKAEGTGLGLALVKAMVELCGGTISAQSSPSGTAFDVSLPQAQAPL